MEALCSDSTWCCSSSVMLQDLLCFGAAQNADLKQRERNYKNFRSRCNLSTDLYTHVVLLRMESRWRPALSFYFLQKTVRDQMLQGLDNIQDRNVNLKSIWWDPHLFSILCRCWVFCNLRCIFWESQGTLDTFSKFLQNGECKFALLITLFYPPFKTLSR